MFKAIAFASIFGAFIFTLPTPVRALDPVTAYVAGRLGNGLADEVWSRVTNKPDIRLLDRRLKELEQNAVLHDDMRREVAKLRAGITNNVTRDEFRAMTDRVTSEIGAIKRRLDNLEQRVERLEVENADLKAGTKNASSAAFFTQRADQMQKNGDMERALANLNIALTIDPAYASAYRARCEIYARRGAWGVVLADTTEAVAQVKSPEAWFYRQRALARAQMWNLRPYRFAASQSHTKSPPIFDADLKSFGEDASRALAHDSADAAVLYVRGLSRIHAGDNTQLPLQFGMSSQEVTAFIARQEALRRPLYEDALADFNAAIKADTQHALAYCGRGLANSRLRNSKAVLEDYNESIRLDPSQKDAYVARASIAADKASSIDDWSKAHALDPADINILYHRAYRYGGTDNHKAIADWLQMTKLDPTYQHAYYMLGIVYYNVGDKENASRYSALAHEIKKAQEGK